MKWEYIPYTNERYPRQKQTDDGDDYTNISDERQCRCMDWRQLSKSEHKIY
jgi:hypothetical protein